MRYEAHVTIDGRRQAQWIAHCRELCVKQVAIQLHGGGEHEYQDMCTQQFSDMTLLAAIEKTKALAEEIERRGHVVLRQKLEADLSTGMNEYDVDYYEGHIKLAVDTLDRNNLVHLSGRLGLALSESRLRPRQDGKKKWFLTDRVSGNVGMRSALAVFAETLGLVRERFPEAKMEREAVLIDSCHAIDAGWNNADLSLVVA